MDLDRGVYQEGTGILRRVVPTNISGCDAGVGQRSLCAGGADRRAGHSQCEHRPGSRRAETWHIASVDDHRRLWLHNAAAITDERRQARDEGTQPQCHHCSADDQQATGSTGMRDNRAAGR